jgi:hypothetical protein
MSKERGDIRDRIMRQILSESHDLSEVVFEINKKGEAAERIQLLRLALQAATDQMLDDYIQRRLTSDKVIQRILNDIAVKLADIGDHLHYIELWD